MRNTFKPGHYRPSLSLSTFHFVLYTLFMNSIRLFLLLLLIPVTGALSARQDFAITGVRVFDGENTVASTNVVVRDGRIAEIGDRVNADGLPRIDGSGATLLPGLIDAHAHTQEIGQLQESLRFGVTTVLDMGTFPIEMDKVLREAASTRADVADFRSAGIMATATGGHGTEFRENIPTVSGPEDAAGFVRDRVQGGADYLKIVMNGVRSARSGMPTLSPETVQALVSAGHDHGLQVWAHIESVEDVHIAVDAGVDGLVHHWRDSGAQPELAALLARENIYVIPTLTAVDGVTGTGPRQLLADPLISPYLSELSRRELTKELNLGQGIGLDTGLAAVRSLVEAGVVILAGADAFTGNPRIVHGASLHRLLELSVMAGLSPEATLRSATSNVADAFGLADRGRIRPGLRADLLLVRGNPAEDINASRDILQVWRGGVELDRTEW